MRKELRLKKTWEYQKVIKNRRKLINENFTFFYLITNKEKGQETNCKFGISVPQKIVKSSVKRNKCKRRIKSIIHLLEKEGSISEEMKGYYFVIILRENFIRSEFLTNKERVKELFTFFERKRIIERNKKKISNYGK